MLILTRRPGQSICIGDDIKVTVVTGSNEPTIAIEASDDVTIVKKDLPIKPFKESASTPLTEEPATHD